MAGFRGLDNSSTQRGGDRLMAEADAENRDATRELSDNALRTSSFLRRAGSRRQDDRARTESPDFRRRRRIVAQHERLLAKPLEITGQIMDEAVVVVDEQNQLMASRSPRALCQVSWYSSAGFDWATMPPPTGSCHQPRPAVIVLIRILASIAPLKPMYASEPQ